MPQPDFVPERLDQTYTPGDEYPPAQRWLAERPAEIKTIFQPDTQRFGRPGPDQGYGIKLANVVAAKAKLKGEHLEDVIAGCLAVGLQRAALFGRAPVIYDFEHAFALWGFLGDAPDELVAFRKPLFEAASHHYWDQREIADKVPEATLRLSHSVIAERVADWRSLVVV